jgi:PKD domain-containing protein
MARRVLPTTLVAAVLAMLTAASASAAPTWLSPKDLSATGGDAGDTQVAVDPQGDSFAVWRHFDGAHSIVQGAVRPAGGDWSRPQDLSALGFDSFKEHVDVDPNGNAVAVWFREIGSKSQVEVSTLSPGSTTWSPPQPVSDSANSVSDTSVAMGPRGDAIVSWVEFDGVNDFVEASRRAAGSTTWSQQKEVSPGGQNASDARVAVDPQGSAVAVFVVQGSPNAIYGATLPAIATSWTTPKQISDSGKGGFEPDVALDPSGNATAVWTQDDAGVFTIEGSSLAAGASTWTAQVPLSADSNIGANRAHVVIDGSARAYSSWRIDDGTTELVQAAVKPPGGSWSMPQTLSTPGHDAFRPDLAVNAGGDVVVAWEQTSATSQFVDASSRPAGATSFGAGQHISAGGQDAHDPRVGVDATGDATAIWNRSDGTNQIAQAAGYDAAGPQLRSLSAPAGGQAFLPIAFSVTPVDVWSPVAGVSWSFGDGSAASGASVSHTFLNVGTFPVGVTASDSLGNSSSAQSSIAIGLAKPNLGGVGESARVWREGSRLPSFSRARRIPRGTTFRLTLNEPAKVVFTFQRLVTGRKAGHRCVALTPRNRARRRCTRKVVAGRLSHSYTAGRHKLRFQGRLSRHKKLKLGRYTLRLTATNSLGQRSATRLLSFRIVR